ncbi:Lysophospholipase 1 [Bulinus truncatus]|nr:Lysophospholipase 1 [Bulinus truncatus]
MLFWQCTLFSFTMMVTGGLAFNSDSIDALVAKLLNNKTFMEMFNDFHREWPAPIFQLQKFPCLQVLQARHMTGSNSNINLIHKNINAERNIENVNSAYNHSNKYTPPTAKSVHELRPSDIKVIAALGDSVTAGRSAGSDKIIAILHDYRGLSWSVGGDESYSSFPSLVNILKHFNPEVYGFSTGVDNENRKLNMAVSGATSYELVDQAVRLVDELSDDPKVDIKKDWKLVTVFIGANDLCQRCHEEISPDDFKKNLEVALDTLAQLPRTLVNVVELFNIELLGQLRRFPVCPVVQRLVCDCAALQATNEDLEKFRQIRAAFQKQTEELVTSQKYVDRDDFTVVLQPFYRDSTLPTLGNNEVDFSYFAVDCFHPSKKGQSLMAISLWNNMLESVNKKSTKINWSEAFELKCPTESSPYIYTQRNSVSKLEVSHQKEPDKTDTVDTVDMTFFETVSIIVSSIVGLALLSAAVFKCRQRKMTNGYREFS